MAEVNAVEETVQEEDPELELLDDELETDNVEEQEPQEKNEGQEPKFDREKFQKQNRELGNLKRELKKREERDAQRDAKLAELEAMLLKKPQADTAADRHDAENVKDEVSEMLESVKDRADDDLITVSEYKQAVGKLGSLIKKANNGGDVNAIRDELEAMRAKLEKVEGETSNSSAFRKAEEAWDENYPTSAGQFKKFNSRAMKLAREQLNEDGNTPQVIGLATYLLNVLGRKAEKQKPSGSTKDNTAMHKPATSTRGTASGKSGAAPGPDLDEADVMDLRRYILQNDPDLKA